MLDAKIFREIENWKQEKCLSWKCLCSCKLYKMDARPLEFVYFGPFCRSTVALL